MGNLSSSHHRHQHYIENENEYSIELLGKLNELRQQGSLCDITFTSDERLKAHSAVLSFQPPLHELTSTLGETVAVHIESTDSKTTNGADHKVPEDDGLVSHLRVDKLTVENDLETETEKQCDTETTNEGEGETEVENEEAQQSTVPQKDTDDTESSENATDNGSDWDVAPPLSTELGAMSTDNEKIEPNTTTEENTTDVDRNESQAIEDPVEALVNYLYTSHVDITKSNVTKIRELASQCVMEDIANACDEFERVLSIETEGMVDEAEKEATAAQLRYRYSDPLLPSKVLKHVNALRSGKEHTDVIVVSSSKKVRYDAHLCVLSCATDFFQSLLTTMDEQNKELVVHDIDDAMLEDLLNYFYTGRISVTSQTVADLMRESEKMHITAIIEGCAEFLESVMNVNTCVQHLSIAIDHHHERLKDALHKFIAINFNAVVRTPEFMTLPLGTLMQILTSNQLELDVPISTGEMSVFKAAKKWIVHDELNRKQYLEEVMSSVRFPLIGERDLVDHVTTDQMVMGNENLCKHITDVIASKPLHVFTRPVQMRGSEYVLTIGGSYPVDDVTSQEQGYTAVGYDNHFTLYDPHSGRSHELALMSETRALHCIAACEQFLFVVGGFDSYSCIVNSVHCFDLSTGSWHEMPNMRVKRSCFSLHVVSGIIYAVGGLTPNGYTATAERLNRRSKKWELVSPLPETRYRHAGCVVDGNIMITGGYSKKDTTLSYNPDKKEWKKLPPLNIGRDSHVMLEVKNKAFVLGGDGIDFSVETFENGVWSLVTDVNMSCRQLFLPGAAGVGENIYLIGGWERENEVSLKIRCLNTTTRIVEETHMMTIPRGSSSSCTIRIPKNYWKTKFSTKMATT